MVCADDLYFTLTFGSVVLCIWYLLVWLPDNKYIVKSLTSFTVTTIIMGIVSYHFPSAISDNPLIVFATFASVFLFLILMSVFLGGLVSIAFSLLFIGPGIAVLQDGVENISLDVIGSKLPPIGVIIAIVVVVAVAVILYLTFKNSTWFHVVVIGLALSIGVTLGSRILYFRTIDNESTYCCSSDDFSTCPVYGSVFIIPLFIGALGLRFFMEWQWRSRGNWFFIHLKDRERDKLKKHKDRIRKELEDEISNGRKSRKQRENEETPLLEISTEPRDRARSTSKPKPKPKPKSNHSSKSRKRATSP